MKYKTQFWELTEKVGWAMISIAHEMVIDCVSLMNIFTSKNITYILGYCVNGRKASNL